MPVTAFTPHAPKPVPHANCSQCQRPMWIVRIQPVGLGLDMDMRTFECPECKREETVIVKRA